MEERGRRVRLVQFINTFVLGGGEVQFVELLKGLVGRADLHVCALDPAGPLLEPVRALGLRPEAFPLSGSLLRPATPLQIVRLARYLRRHRAQVLHAHDFYSSLLAIPAARLAGCKVVVSRLDLVHWHGRWRHRALALATRQADHVVANAQAIRRFLVAEEGIAPERITVIRNGLDLVDFDRRQAEGLLEPLPVAPGPRALLVANMHYPVKRQEDFIQAIALARREQPELQAFLVGDGVRRGFLEAEAQRLGVGEVVHFLGHRLDVPALWTHVDVGVLCSEREGLSNAITEGMASRIPMVVTEAGGNPELVQNGVRGWVVPVGRPEALARALIAVLSDRTAARRMGEAGRTFVAGALTFDRMVESHLQLYARLARPSTAAASSERAPAAMAER